MPNVSNHTLDDIYDRRKQRLTTRGHSYGSRRFARLRNLEKAYIMAKNSGFHKVCNSYRCFTLSKLKTESR